MMSAGKGATAANGEQYYYQRDPMIPEDKQSGQWVGKGAQSLGLVGAVDFKDFQAVLRGQDPRTGEQLVEIKNGTDPEQRRAYNDYTFSAGKSLSIAYGAGVDELKELWDESVLATVGIMEGHYSHARVDGVHVNGSLVGAKNDHFTSRALDQQLHSHVVVLNMTQPLGDKWRANDPVNIYKDQKTLGLLQRQDFAYRLQQRGFELEWTDREQLFFELKGVDKDLISAFSQRREAIEAQVAEWKAAGIHKNIPNAKLYEMAALGTRETKDKNITREQVEATQKKVYDKVGLTPESVKQSVESVRQQNINNPKQMEKVDAKDVINEAARILTDKEAVIDRAEMVKVAAQISGGKHSINELTDAIDKHTVRLGQDKWGREHYTTRDMIRLEKSNLDKARSQANTFASITNKRELDDYRGKWEAHKGFELTRGQYQMAANELLGGHGISVTQGDPGTGKTTAIGFIEDFNRDVLKPTGREHVSHNGGYTGPAATALQNAAGKQASTLDSLLNAYHAGRTNIGVSAKQDGIQRQEVIRIDEASFLSAENMSHYLGIQENTSRLGGNIKIHTLGDTKQLPSVSSGKPYAQLQTLSAAYANHARLVEIRRQKNLELRAVTTTLNDTSLAPGERAAQALQMLDAQGRITEMSDRRELVQAAATWAREENTRVNENGEKYSVFINAPLNRDRNELNQAIRDKRVEAGELTAGKTFTVWAPIQAGPTSGSYQIGDKFVFSGSRDATGKPQKWGAPLYTEGTVTGINHDKNRITVHWTRSDKNGRERHYTKDFSASAAATKSSTYRLSERTYSVGETVMNLKNSDLPMVDGGTAKINNSDIGQIKNIDKNGVATIEYTQDKNKITVQQRLDGSHTDYGYAGTVHKTQGAGFDSSGSFFAPDVKTSAAGKKHYATMSYQLLNVSLSRCIREQRMFTTDKQAFAENVRSVDKTSTLDHDKPGATENTTDREKSHDNLDASRELSDSVAGLKADLQQARSHNSRDKTPTDSLSQSVANLRREIEQAKSGAGRDSDHHQERQHEASRTSEISNVKELE